MPYAFVGSGSVSPTQSGNSRTLSATFNAGETVFVIVQAWNGGPTTLDLELSDGANTWVEAGRVEDGSGSTQGSSIVWKADNVAAGTVTLTLARSSGLFTGDSFNFYRYTGLAAGPVQVSGGRNYNPNGTGGADNVVGATLTPTSQPAMLLAAAWSQNDGTQPSASPSSNDRGQLDPGVPRGRVEDRRLTSTASVTPVFTTTNNFENHEIIAVIVSESATPRDLAAQATATATATAALRVGKPLAAQATATATVLANLAVSGDTSRPLAATPSATATATAALRVGKPLAAPATATATATAALSVAKPLAAAGTATATATAALAVVKPLPPPPVEIPSGAGGPNGGVRIPGQPRDASPVRPPPGDVSTREPARAARTPEAERQFAAISRDDEDCLNLLSALIAHDLIE